MIYLILETVLILVVVVVVFCMIGAVLSGASSNLTGYVEKNYTTDTLGKFERPTLKGAAELFKFLFKGVFVLGFIPGLIYGCCMFCKYVAN